MYTYGDPDDAITRSLVAGRGADYPRYWELSEQRVMTIMERHIAAYRERRGRPQLLALDAGCGEGRLLPWLAARSARLVAVEPDAERLALARSLVEGTADAAKVDFCNAAVQDADVGADFDVIVSSHVLQHLHTADVPRVLAAMRARLRPGGLLLLTTCHSTSDRDYYEEGRLVDGIAELHEVSRARFDAEVYSGGGALLCRYFPRPVITGLLDELDLSVREFRVFHLTEAELRGSGSDCAAWLAFEDRVNDDEALQRRVGEDMLIVAERR